MKMSQRIHPNVLLIVFISMLAVFWLMLIRELLSQRTTITETNQQKTTSVSVKSDENGSPVVSESTTQNNPYNLTITISSDSIEPTNITLTSQTIVRWLNRSPAAQNLTFLGETIVIPPNGEYLLSFSTVMPGQYVFQLSPLGVNGVITVTEY